MEGDELPETPDPGGRRSLRRRSPISLNESPDSLRDLGEGAGYRPSRSFASTQACM